MNINNKAEIVDRFLQFLGDNKCSGEYAKEMFSEHQKEFKPRNNWELHEFFENVNCDMWIHSAFDWRSTKKRGYDFWAMLNYEWQKILANDSMKYMTTLFLNFLTRKSSVFRYVNLFGIQHGSIGDDVIEAVLANIHYKYWIRAPFYDTVSRHIPITSVVLAGYWKQLEEEWQAEAGDLEE